MTVESQNYNIVPARIWDSRLKGFRPMTRAEQAAIATGRSNGYKLAPAISDELFRRMRVISERVQ
jgi:hypothetical protein